MGKIDVFRKDDSGFSMTFPQKLMELLSCDDTNEYIAWVPTGDAFMIFDESSFVENVLSRFFTKKTKFRSFKGKLYRWGFKRVVKGTISGAFYHKYFLRNNPALCLHIRRVGKNILETDGVPKSIEIVSEKNPLKKMSKLLNMKNKRPESSSSQVITNPVELLDDVTTNRSIIPTLPKLPNSELLSVPTVACGEHLNQVLIQSLAEDQLRTSFLQKRIAGIYVRGMYQEPTAKLMTHFLSQASLFEPLRQTNDINFLNNETRTSFTPIENNISVALDALISMRS